MRSFIPKFLLLLSLVLSACGPSGSLTPEMAVLKQMNAASRVDPASIQILQSQTYKNHVLSLVSYTGTSQSGERKACTTFYDSHRGSQFTWLSDARGTACWTLGPFGDRSIGSGGGVASLTPPDQGTLYSYLYGDMIDPKIVQVTVTWEDGQTQTTPVSNGTYLAIRGGQHSYRKAEGKDKSGKVLNTQEFSQP